MSRAHDVVCQFHFTVNMMLCVHFMDSHEQFEGEASEHDPAKFAQDFQRPEEMMHQLFPGCGFPKGMVYAVLGGVVLVHMFSISVVSPSGFCALMGSKKPNVKINEFVLEDGKESSFARRDQSMASMKSRGRGPGEQAFVLGALCLSLFSGRRRYDGCRVKRLAQGSHAAKKDKKKRKRQLDLELFPKAKIPYHTDDCPPGIESMAKWSRKICDLPKVRKLGKSYFELVEASAENEDMKQYLEWVLVHPHVSSKVKDLHDYLIAIEFESKNLAAKASAAKSMEISPGPTLEPSDVTQEVPAPPTRENKKEKKDKNKKKRKKQLDLELLDHSKNLAAKASAAKSMEISPGPTLEPSDVTQEVPAPPTRENKQEGYLPDHSEFAKEGSWSMSGEAEGSLRLGIESYHQRIDTENGASSNCSDLIMSSPVGPQVNVSTSETTTSVSVSVTSPIPGTPLQGSVSVSKSKRQCDLAGTSTEESSSLRETRQTDLRESDGGKAESAWSEVSWKSEVKTTLQSGSASETTTSGKLEIGVGIGGVFGGEVGVGPKLSQTTNEMHLKRSTTSISQEGNRKNQESFHTAKDPDGKVVEKTQTMTEEVGVTVKESHVEEQLDINNGTQECISQEEVHRNTVHKRAAVEQKETLSHDMLGNATRTTVRSSTKASHTTQGDNSVFEEKTVTVTEKTTEGIFENETTETTTTTQKTRTETAMKQKPGSTTTPNSSEKESETTKKTTKTPSIQVKAAAFAAAQVAAERASKALYDQMKSGKTDVKAEEVGIDAARTGGEVFAKSVLQKSIAKQVGCQNASSAVVQLSCDMVGNAEFLMQPGNDRQKVEKMAYIGGNAVRTYACGRLPGPAAPAVNAFIDGFGKMCDGDQEGAAKDLAKGCAKSTVVAVTSCLGPWGWGVQFLAFHYIDDLDSLK